MKCGGLINKKTTSIVLLDIHLQVFATKKESRMKEAKNRHRHSIFLFSIAVPLAKDQRGEIKLPGHTGILRADSMIN